MSRVLRSEYCPSQRHRRALPAPRQPGLLRLSGQSLCDTQPLGPLTSQPPETKSLYFGQLNEPSPSATRGPSPTASRSTPTTPPHPSLSQCNMRWTGSHCGKGSPGPGHLLESGLGSVLPTDCHLISLPHPPSDKDTSQGPGKWKLRARGEVQTCSRLFKAWVHSSPPVCIQEP